MRANEVNYDAKTTRSNRYPKITKLGVCSPYGEETPFVWNGKLMRMELRDPMKGWEQTDTTVDKDAIIRDCETGEIISHLAADSYYHSAYIEGDTAYVLGVDLLSRDTIRIYSSKDLIHWDNRVLFTNPGWVYCNTGLTKGPDGYVLMLEAAEPAQYVGDHPYTFVFATSPDLQTWTHMDPNLAYPMDRYAGAPWFRYSNGWYYAIMLVELPCVRYTNYLFRTKDFVNWEVGNYNPILMPSEEDHILSPRAADITPEFFAEIQNCFNINNSDIDMCDYNGKVYINYLCGNQLGMYYMCEAEAEGTVDSFLASYFE